MLQQTLPPENVVQTQLDAYNRRDLAGFAATYSPAITITRLPSGEDTLSGLAALREAYGQLFTNNPELHCKLLQRIVQGRFVIDHEEISGRADNVVVHAVVIYQVEAGLIERVWVTRG